MKGVLKEHFLMVSCGDISKLTTEANFKKLFLPNYLTRSVNLMSHFDLDSGDEFFDRPLDRALGKYGG